MGRRRDLAARQRPPVPRSPGGLGECSGRGLDGIGARGDRRRGASELTDLVDVGAGRCRADNTNREMGAGQIDRWGAPGNRGDERGPRADAEPGLVRWSGWRWVAAHRPSARVVPRMVDRVPPGISE